MEPFRFKQFAVNHHRSAMKVGIDSVLLGAWATHNLKNDRPEFLDRKMQCLDIGTGCGLLALITAQRFPHARILGVEINADAAEEAAENFYLSPWKHNLRALTMDINEFSERPENSERFDFIISNPPFFDDGIKIPKTDRELARHQFKLSPQILLKLSDTMLGKGGILCLVSPLQMESQLLDTMKGTSLSPLKICRIADRPEKMAKRVILYAGKSGDKSQNIPEMTELFIRNRDGEYSEEYRQITRDFYLNF